MGSFFKSTAGFVIGTAKRAWWLLPALLLDPFDLLELAGLEIAIPGPVLWWTFGIAIFLSAATTYHKERVRADQLQDRLAPKVSLVVPEAHEMRREGLSRLPPNFTEHKLDEPVPTESLLLRVENLSGSEPAASVQVQVIRAEPDIQGGIDLLPHNLPWFDYESSFEAEIPTAGYRFIRVFDVYHLPGGLAVNSPTHAHVGEVDEVRYTLTAWAVGSAAVSREIVVTDLSSLLVGELPVITDAGPPNEG